MSIDLRHLEVVEAISRTGSATRAAEHLRVTQPAVSHTLRQIEEWTGVQLFERVSRGMILTGVGERVLRTARSVLGEMSRLEHDLAEARKGATGFLRLATEGYTCYHWLPSVVERFLATLSHVDLQVEPGLTQDPLEGLRDGRLDVALVRSDHDPGRVVVEPVFEDELVLLVRSGHPLAGRGRILPGDLQGQVVLVHSRNEERAFFEEVLEAHEVKPERVLEVHLTEAVIAGARSGLGLGVLPRWAAAAGSGDGLEVRSFAGGGLLRRWKVACLKERRSDPAVRELVRILREEAAGAS